MYGAAAGPQLANFLREVYARAQLSPGIHAFVKISKFGVPYLSVFGTDSSIF